MPPVVITLTATITQLAANLTTAGEEFGAMGATATAAGAEITAGMAEAEAGVGRFTGTLKTEATAVTASNDQILASFAKLGAAADRTAEQFYVDYNGMAAKSQMLATQMEAANAKAIASTEAMGAKIDEVGAKSVGFGAAMEAASKKMLLMGAAGLVVGVVVGKMAADFESSTTRLVTSAGETASNLAMVRDGILSLAGQVGYSAEELSKAMYTIESGGQHGADGLKVLQAAAEGAKTENAELKTVADAVTSVLVDYHLKADDAASVTSKLVAATSAGKTTFEELSGAMSAVLPVASAAHVSLDDILGDMAAMTVHGMSAQQSAQNLTDVIRHMQSPTAVQSKELALLGMNAQDLAGNLGTKGLSGTLQEIANKIQSSMGPGSQKVILDLGTALKSLPKDVQALGQKLMDGTITQAAYNKEAKGFDPIAAHQAAAFATLAASTHTIGGAQMTGGQVMQSYGQALNKATGDATGLNVALMLTGENADVTNGAIKTVAGAATEAGNHVKGWAEIQATFNQKLAQAKDGLGAMAIAVGEKLLPVMTAIIGVVGRVTSFIADNKAATVIAASVIGVLLVAGLVGATIAVWNFTAALLANPITWVVVAIVALGVAIYELIKHWKDVMAFLAPIGAWFKTEVIDPIVRGWNALMNFLRPLGQWMKANIIDPIVSGWKSLVDWAQKIWPDVQKVIDNFGTWLKAFFTPIWAFIMLFVDAFAGAFKNAWNDIANFLKDAWDFVVATLKFGWDIIVTTFKAAVEIISGIVKGVIEVIKGIIDFVVGVFSGDWKRAWDGIKEIFSGIWDAVKGILGGVWDFITGIFKDAGTWLWNAGKAILSGLLDGLKAAWNAVTGFIGGIGSWISDHKGPIEVDRVLLTPHGNAIMDGLLGGLKTGGKRVQSYLDTFTTDVGTIGVDAGLTVAGGITPAAFGGAVRPNPNAVSQQPQQLVVNLNSRDVQNWLQTGTLRYDLRNANNGMTVRTS
jgi:TP901 family phage tail tape measure protein